MNSTVRIALAATILGGGAYLASQFRHEPRPAPAPGDNLFAPLAQATPVAPPPAPVADLPRPENPAGATSDSTRGSGAAWGNRPADPSAWLSTPQEWTERLPSLSAEYPGPENNAAQAESKPADAVRKHVVRDGDTLDQLAQRYLGDARRSQEIFEANADLLIQPDLLPIGARLQIPPQARPVAEKAHPTSGALERVVK